MSMSYLASSCHDYPAQPGLCLALLGHIHLVFCCPIDCGYLALVLPQTALLIRDAHAQLTLGIEPDWLSGKATLCHVRVLTWSMTGPDPYSHVTVNDTDRTVLACYARARIIF
jgi:hypothetical protein